MANPISAEDELTPAQARIVARMRALMLVSAAATTLGIAVVIGVIGYRVYRGDGSGGVVDTTAPLPAGARIVQTAVTGDRIVVTLDIGGVLEIRTFDARTLRQQGRLRFAPER